MSVVIPDSITPVEGWRAWDLYGNDNLLQSPNYSLTWMPGEKATALCPHVDTVYEWVVAPGSPPPELPSKETEETTGFVASTVAASLVSLSTMPTTAISIPAQPRVLLPEGKHWHLELRKVMHDAPEMDCSCGIYIANDVRKAAAYGGILGKVKGWGRTIEHKFGWRVQYAYPSELYVPTALFPVPVMSALERYGVPVTPSEMAEDERIKAIYEQMAEFVEVSPTREITDFVAKASVPVLGGVAGMEAFFYYMNPSPMGFAAFTATTVAAGLMVGLRLRGK